MYQVMDCGGFCRCCLLSLHLQLGPATRAGTAPTPGQPLTCVSPPAFRKAPPRYSWALLTNKTFKSPANPKHKYSFKSSSISVSSRVNSRPRRLQCSLAAVAGVGANFSLWFWRGNSQRISSGLQMKACHPMDRVQHPRSLGEFSRRLNVLGHAWGEIQQVIASSVLSLTLPSPSVQTRRMLSVAALCFHVNKKRV